VERVFVGHDWAETHHDIYVEDGDGRRLARARVPEGVEGVSRFHELVAPFAEEPGEVVVATETDRGLFVGALVAAGYQVLAVNPLSTSRYRERHSTSGAKSDPGDAFVLAELARLDRHNHRPIAGDSELAEAVKVLARAHQSLIWTRQRQTNQLRSVLREFFPAALDAFDDLGSGDALAVLAVAPTPTLGRRLSRSKIAAVLRRGGRQRRIEERAAEIQTALRADHLAAPGLVAEAMGATVRALVAVTAELVTQIAGLETELADRFDQQSSGMTRTAIAMPSLARTTPAPHQSPALRANTESCWHAMPARPGSPTPATCGPSPPCPPVPAPATSTTNTEPPATPTTKPSAPWPTASSASSTAASDTTPPTTNTPPGPTTPTSPLDTLGPWDV
jgi:transposase